MRKWAAKLPELREVERRLGKPPGPLLEKPKLLPCNNLYWLAFCNLNKHKSITYQELLAFSELSNLDKTELMVKIETIEDALNEEI